MTHLPILQILLPMLAAPSCVILRHRLLVRGFATLIAFAAFAVSIALMIQVQARGAVSYHLGGWAPPWGIELRADALTTLVLLVVTAVAAVVLSTGLGRDHSVPEGREAYFYAAFLLCLAGLLGMTMTGDAFNVFVFLEIASLSTYALVALGATRRALTAALFYLMIGTVAGTFYLLGVGLLYQATGTLNMADLASRLAELDPSHRTFMVGFVFVTLGLALKVAVYPMHQWLPNAYAFAPSTAGAFIAGTATKVSYYLLLRFLFTVCGASVAFETFGLGGFLLPVSLLAMFAASVAAIYQADFKRLLAYSSVGQLGYMTLGLSLGTELGVKAGLIHVFNHAFMKSGLFLVAAAVVMRVGSSRIDDFSGIGKRMPLTTAALVVGGLGLVGVPGTSGFISKWYLVLAAFDAGHSWLALAILLSSLLAVAYVWRVVEIAYFRPLRREDIGDDPPSVTIPAWVLLGATVFFGFFPELPISWGQAAVDALNVGGQP